MSHEVLVLNNDFQPLHVCKARRALALVYLGKAEVLHTHGCHIFHTADGACPAPSVVRLRRNVRRPMPELRCNRHSVFARDHFTCQYCGQRSQDLTIDHVIPRRLGGQGGWDNLVAACRKCNMRKGDKLLHQSGMSLLRPPRRPRYIPYISLPTYVAGQRNEVWQLYLPVYTDLRDPA